MGYIACVNSFAELGVFGRVAHGALAKAKLQSPRIWNEAKLADEMARRPCGLDDHDATSQSILIHINELDAEPPIEAELIAEQVIEAPVQH
jgi:hypothetical protein